MAAACASLPPVDWGGNLNLGLAKFLSLGNFNRSFGPLGNGNRAVCGGDVARDEVKNPAGHVAGMALPANHRKA